MLDCGSYCTHSNGDYGHKKGAKVLDLDRCIAS